jgi:hypothetical protein
MPDHFEDCAGEKAESFAVVVKTVNAVAPEVVFVVDEVIGCVVNFPLEDAAVLLTPADGNLEIAYETKRVAKLRLYAFIERENNASILPGFTERGRERPGDICKPAGCDIRERLGSGIENIHRVSLSLYEVFAKGA